MEKGKFGTRRIGPACSASAIALSSPPLVPPPLSPLLRPFSFPPFLPSPKPNFGIIQFFRIKFAH
jgi:hypothetical protein